MTVCLVAFRRRIPPPMERIPVWTRRSGETRQPPDEHLRPGDRCSARRGAAPPITIMSYGSLWQFSATLLRHHVCGVPIRPVLVALSGSLFRAVRGAASARRRALADVERRCRVQKCRATISRAAYLCHRRPPARTQGGTCQSSIRSRSERRNRCYEPSHGAPAHLARPAVGRTVRCSTEAR